MFGDKSNTPGTPKQKSGPKPKNATVAPPEEPKATEGLDNLVAATDTQSVDQGEIDPPPKPAHASAASIDLQQRQAMAVGRQKRLDARVYEEAEPGMQFMWINDLDGEVQKWLSIGAAPQERTTLHGKIYPGLNDHGANEYVKVHGGADEGGRPFYVYLLKMDKDEYYTVKTEPLIKRQNEIRDAMGIGSTGVESGEDLLPSGNAIKTYAANNIVGGKGFMQQKQTV